MKTTITLQPDGALFIATVDDTKLDAKGQPLLVGSRTIHASQFVAHRRDPEFDAALPADVKAAIDAAAAKA